MEISARIFACATKIEPVYGSKEQYQQLLGEHIAQLSS